MNATASTPPAATDATPPVGINMQVFDDQCARLGATNDVARAALVEVDRATLWRWRRGRQKPGIDAITRIADLFGISVEALIGRRAS